MLIIVISDVVTSTVLCVVRTVCVFQKLLDGLVGECYDSIAIFLCIHVVHKYRVLMTKRSVPALDRSANVTFCCV